MENQFEPLTIYKTQQEITNTKELPVLHEDRICTDIFCTIFSTILAVTMLVLACVFFDSDKLAKTTYPTDLQGRLCTLDNPTFNYLYFTSPSDPSKRLCVENCPKGGQKSLECWPSDELSCHQNDNPEFQVAIYPSVQADTSMGLFCMPEDQKLKEQLLKNSKLHEKYTFTTAYRSILYSALAAIGLGLLFLFVTSLTPGFMVYTSIILGGLGCTGVGSLLLATNSQLLHVYQILRVLFSIFIILIGLMCLLSLYVNAGDLKLCIAYLKYGGQFLGKSIWLILMVFIFYMLMAGLIALMVFQILAYWSAGELQFTPQEVHKSLGSPLSTVLIIICGIQWFWGMAFLKQSFDFIVSGTTVYYYFKQLHFIPFALGNLFKFHWGSVVAGSFLLNFFYVFDIFYDFLKPKEQNTLNIFTKVCCCCDRVLGMARSDTFSFVNLIGQPYCNSARYCEEIDDKSIHFEGSQSVFRFFRIGAHVMLASFATLLCYFLMNGTSEEVSVLGLIVSFLVNLFMVTFFVCLIAQMAEAILLCTLVQKYLKNENQIASQYRSSSLYHQPAKNNHNNSFYEAGYTIHETNQ